MGGGGQGEKEAQRRQHLNRRTTNIYEGENKLQFNSTPHCLSAYYVSGAVEFMGVKVVATCALMEVVVYT